MTNDISIVYVVYKRIQTKYLRGCQQNKNKNAKEMVKITLHSILGIEVPQKFCKLHIRGLLVPT